MMAAEEYYIFTGREAVPPDVTRVRIDKSISVIPARAFYNHPNIIELDCHIDVKKVERYAIYHCHSLRRVIMPGVKEVEGSAFFGCYALTDVECNKLEIIRGYVFTNCNSLRSINLPSIKIVEGYAFISCIALANVKFGDKLESIGGRSFFACNSLERITLPLKDGTISDDAFQRCGNLKRVNLVEGSILHQTIDALLLEEWRNDMRRNIDAIKQILSNGPADGDGYEDVGGGGKTEAIRTWIRSVLRKIVHYKSHHHRYLNEAAATLELALWKKRLSEINIPEGDDEDEGRAKCRVKCGADIVMKNVLPFLELSPYTFEWRIREGGRRHEEEGNVLYSFFGVDL